MIEPRHPELLIHEDEYPYHSGNSRLLTLLFIPYFTFTRAKAAPPKMSHRMMC